MTEPVAPVATPASAPRAVPRKPVVTDKPMADIASVQGIAFPPKPSPSQLAAAEMRKTLMPIVEIVEGENASGMRRAGAALFVAHMATELPEGATPSAHPGAPLGLEATATMSPDEVLKYTHTFRARYPAAWGAAATCNTQGFVRHLKIAGLRSLPGDETLELQIVTLQALMSKLAVVE